MKTSVKFFLISIALFTIISCKKVGPPGVDGNANVKYSSWVKYEANWLNSAKLKIMEIEVPEYTTEFQNDGFLFTFIRYQSNIQYLLPFSSRFNSPSSPIVAVDFTPISFDEYGKLRVNCYRPDGGDIQSEFTNIISENRLEVRYMLIQANELLTSNRFKNKEELSDYLKSKSFEDIVKEFEATEL